MGRRSQQVGGLACLLDEMRIVVGVEVFTLDADIPREKLIREFHMREEDLAVLGAPV